MSTEANKRFLAHMGRLAAAGLGVAIVGVQKELEEILEVEPFEALPEPKQIVDTEGEEVKS